MTPESPALRYEKEARHLVERWTSDFSVLIRPKIARHQLAGRIAALTEKCVGEAFEEGQKAIAALKRIVELPCCKNTSMPGCRTCHAIDEIVWAGLADEVERPLAENGEAHD